MKKLMILLALCSVSTFALVDMEVVEKRVNDKMVESFLKEANDEKSEIGGLISMLREDNRDGRNMDGGFPEVFTANDLQLFMISKSEDARIRCGIDANDRLSCDARYLNLTFLVAVGQAFCHNAGCDVSTEGLTYQVTASMNETCEGTMDQDPYTDNICKQTYSVSEFKPVSF